MKPTITPSLPTHWSPEQALAVFEYVQTLSEQIWCHYHIDIMNLLGEEAATDIRQLPDNSFAKTLCEGNTDQSDLPF